MFTKMNDPVRVGNVVLTLTEIKREGMTLFAVVRNGREVLRTAMDKAIAVSMFNAEIKKADKANQPGPVKFETKIFVDGVEFKIED